MALELDLRERDGGAIAQALRSLITELIGWGSEPYEEELPPAQ